MFCSISIVFWYILGAVCEQSMIPYNNSHELFTITARSVDGPKNMAIEQKVVRTRESLETLLKQLGL